MAGAAFKVLTQSPTTGRDASGTPTAGYQITAQVVGGSTFQVFVPKAQYTVTTVTGLLQAEANEVAAVDAIGS